MFVETKREGEVTANPEPEVLSVAGLVAWLEKQPPETAYDWYSIDTCILCNYLRAATGEPDPATKRWRGYAGIGTMTLGDHWPYFEICGKGQLTYGAALDRAHALAE